MDFLESADGEVVVADHVGLGHNGAFDIFGQFLARDNLYVGGGVVQPQAIHLLDVVPLLDTVDKLLGILAGDAVGVAFAAGLDDVGVVAHAPFEAFDDGGVLSVHQGIDSGDDILFYFHFL